MATVIFGASGVIVVPLDALKPHGVPGVIVGLLLMGSGVLMGAFALRSDPLTADDEGLRLRTLTGSRVIPWSLIRSFEALQGGRNTWYLRVQLEPDDGIELPVIPGRRTELSSSTWVVLPGGIRGSRAYARRMVGDLTAAHREYLAGWADGEPPSHAEGH